MATNATAPLSPPTEAELLAWGMNLVRKTSRQHARNWWERDEFDGEGYLLLAWSLRNRQFDSRAHLDVYLRTSMKRRISTVRHRMYRMPWRSFQEDSNGDGSEYELADHRHEDASEAAERNELLARMADVRRSIDALPGRDRWILERHYLDELTYKQMAVELGQKSHSRLCMRLRTVIEDMRQRLIEEGCGRSGDD